MFDRETRDMPNDAKMGMIIGIGLVIASAVMFFRKEAASQTAAEQPTPATATRAEPMTVSSAPTLRSSSRVVRAKTAIRTEKDVLSGQRHTVTAGETLFSLARRYYQDESKFVDIYRVNQGVLNTPDPLTPGMVLIIPNVP
jgi:nucleoid-associated protein YgaU